MRESWLRDTMYVRAPLVRESKRVLARTKRDWNVRGATSKGLLYIFFVSRGVKCVVKLVHFICF